MKNPLPLRKVGCVVACYLVLCQAASAAHIDFETSAIYESYDKNPLGDMVGQPSGGYGVTGTYNFQGSTEAAARLAFKIVDGGLPFGTYSSSAGRCVQVNAGSTGTGVGILVDGGKPWGDTFLNRFDVLYCSYLVNYTQASNAPGTRAEVRTSTTATGGDQFQIHSDGAAITEGATSGNGKIQPALAYKGATYDRVQNPVTNDLKVNNTYMMIGRFNNAGNLLGVTPTGTWTTGSTTVTVSSNANIAVGQLVLGVGIAENSMVTGINSTAITLSKPTTADGPAGTKLDFVFIANEVVSCTANYAPPVAPATTTDITMLSSTGSLTVGMIATGTGIPVNTTVQEIITTSPLKVKLSTAVTSTVSSGTIIFRSVVPLNATWGASGSSVITVDRSAAIVVGQGVSGVGIAPGTLVESVGASPNQITLSKPTIAGGSTPSVVYFYQRTASCSLFALSLPQYNHLIGLASQQAKETHLNTAAMGTAADQVTVRIIGTPTTTGSIEFGQGRYIHLIAQGTDASPQIYKMDELRFGFTLRSVTQPATPLSVPVGDPAAFDDSGKRFFYPLDNGYGWKSGFFELEETGSPQGAYLINVTATDAELTPGSTDYLHIQPRQALNTDQGTRRRPDPAVVDMSKPYTASFDFQLKSGFSSFTAFEDRVQFGADAQVTSTGAIAVGSNVGPNPTRPALTASPAVGGTNLSWMAGVAGADGGRGIPIGKWFFYDFDGQSLAGSSPPNYFVGGNMKKASDDDNSESGPNTDSIPGIVTGGTDIGAGGIYSFKFEVNPQTYTYRGTITYRPKSTSPANEIKTYSRGGLRFRDNADANTLFWGVSKSAGESRIFAMDNIRVSPGVDFFPDWVGAYSALGDKTRSADPDSDGRKNFLEYALDGDPSTGTGSGKEIHGVTTISSNRYHTLTVPVRAGFTFAAAASPNTGDLESTFTNNEGIKYRIEGSFDLSNWNATVVEVTPALASTPALTASPGYVYKTFRLAQPISTSQPKGFLRVVVDSTK
ncbi:MAG TPA: hypothetical protein VM511_08425 [Luteolibacter sp.]|nr:hypothetical protein [Luteolibacter sp.]